MKKPGDLHRPASNMERRVRFAAHVNHNRLVIGWQGPAVTGRALFRTQKASA